MYTSAQRLHSPVLTPRLFLREWQLEDAPSLFELNNDPLVVRYTGDEAFSSLQEAEELIRSYDQYQKYGFGRWAVVEQATGKFLGWCGLKHDPEAEETDIGFRFFRDQWGKGFATEAARACMTLAFEKYQLPFVVGRAMQQNLASIRVLEKLGMKYWKFQECGKHPGVVYRLDRQL